MKIIGDILTTTRDDLQDDDGASVTYLIRRANISHERNSFQCHHSFITKSFLVDLSSIVRLCKIQDGFLKILELFSLVLCSPRPAEM